MDRDDDILNYVQGRMTPDEKMVFEASMERDQALAAEVRLMTAVRRGIADGPGHPDPNAGWDRLSDAINTQPQPANDNRRPWVAILRYAGVAAAAVAVWQLAVVPRMDGVADGFGLATDGTVEAYSLQVMFVPNTTLDDVAAVLLPLGGTITDGPSAVGLVRVSFPQEDARAEALLTLEALPDLVAFVSAE